MSWQLYKSAAGKNYADKNEIGHFVRLGKKGGKSTLSGMRESRQASIKGSASGIKSMKELKDVGQ
jgi:hypothetical protein